MDWQYILIHHTGPPTTIHTTPESIRQSHLNKGWVDVGYNYMVDHTGFVHKGRALNIPGAHEEKYNRIAIGVACIGNFEVEQFPAAMAEGLVNLLTSLMRQYDIPAKNVLLHRDVDATLCPGKNFPEQRIKKELESDNVDGTIKGISPSHWAYSDYVKMFKCGLVVGSPLGHMNPDQTITEARMVVFLSRLKDMLDKDAKIKALIEQYHTGVVKINVTGPAHYEPPSWTGTGSFLTPDGYILTNKHVTDLGLSYEVETVWGKFPARFVVNAGSMMAEDSSIDLAILKVELPAGIKPPVIPWGDYKDPVVGDDCIVLGFPLGEKAATFGRISDMHKDEWTQTQAPINPGNSGGISICIDTGVAAGVPTQKAGGTFIDCTGYMTPPSVVKEFLAAKFKP